MSDKNKNINAKLLRAIGGIALGSLATHSAFAQSESQRIADLERKLQRSDQLIEKLIEKVQQLENTKQAAPAAAANAKAAPAAQIAEEAKTGELNKVVAAQNTRIETLQQQVSQISSASASRTIPFDWLHGFADVGGGYGSGGNPKGFGVGSLDLYMTPKLGGNVRALAELLFEYNTAGTLNTDLERAQIGYAFNDQLTVWLGRFHTPYGYWNTAYHHGQQIQPSLLRPRFIDFEDKGGILPSHTTGVWGTGGIRAGDGKVTYDVYAGNTPKINAAGALDPNVAGFANQSLTAGGNVGYQFANTLDGLKLGLHGLRSEVRVDNSLGGTGSVLAVPRRQTDLNMLGGYAYYNNYDWEAIAEVYGFMNHDQMNGTGTHKSWAGFVHLGHAFNRWMPYVRLEKADLDQRDPYFNNMMMGYAYSREAAGIRYDINPNSALKLEANYTQTYDQTQNLQLRNFGRPDFWESRLQYAVRF